MTEPKYIDAEQFKRDNERLLHCDFPYLSEETLEELVDNAPAADVAEIKHGRWVNCDDGSISYRCSVCGKHQYGNFAEIFSGGYHYCPNCGASMVNEDD